MIRRDDREYDDAPMPPRMSTLALTSLLLGISSLCLCVFTGLPAIICGGISLASISRSGGRLTGGILAVFGLILGLIGTCGSTGGFGYLGYSAYQYYEAERLTRTNLRQIGMALHNYHDNYNHFPPAATVTRDGKPGLSWRVLILPYIEQDVLYKQFKLDEPWDSPNNRPLLDRMPAIYASGRKQSGQTTTRFRVFVGPGAAFERNVHTRMIEMIDGTSNTIMVVEAADAVPWTKPDELDFPVMAQMTKLGRSPGAPVLVLMGDGSVRVLSRATGDPVLRAMLTRNGGEVVPFP